MRETAPTTRQEQALFYLRAGAAYRLQRRRADCRGVPLPYDLFDLQALVRSRLGPSACPYCRGPVTAATFAVGPRVPADRGGRFALRDLVVSCGDCARARGPLDDREFRELMELTRAWPRPVQNDLLLRLRAGGRDVDGRLPRPGSLEWFTGSADGHPGVCKAARATRLVRDLRGELCRVLPDAAATVGDPAAGRPDPPRPAAAADGTAGPGGPARGPGLPGAGPGRLPQPRAGAGAQGPGD
jgi:hypothetical protein